MPFNYQLILCGLAVWACLWMLLPVFNVVSKRRIRRQCWRAIR